MAASCTYTNYHLLKLKLNKSIPEKAYFLTKQNKMLKLISLLKVVYWNDKHYSHLHTLSFYCVSKKRRGKGIDHHECTLEAHWNAPWENVPQKHVSEIQERKYWSDSHSKDICCTDTNAVVRWLQVSCFFCFLFMLTQISIGAICWYMVLAWQF